MSGTYTRNRFFQLPKFDSCLSSRFGNIPALMEREPTPLETARYSNSFNPHVVLPPIRYRRFGSNINQESFSPFVIKKPAHSMNSMAHHSILDNLLESMPDIHEVPDIPLIVTPDQENALLLETNYQLANFDPTNLRDLYVTLTNSDTDLTGCISYNDLLFTFQRKQIPITEQLIQLIAAQFVSRNELKKVNYEKVLSFLGAAIKITKREFIDEHFASQVPRSERATPRGNDRQRSPGRALYYHDSSCSNNEESKYVYTEKDDPEILKLLETSVRYQFTPINLESLRLSFQRADRLLRGSLSEAQIKDLCHHHGVKIENSIIEKVIRRCKQRGGGQYDWQQFIRYLERVQPVQTGLDIKASRMPHDYIKYVPHPSSSWPHAETSKIWGSPLHQHYNPFKPIFKETDESVTQLPPPLETNRNHGVQTLSVDNENFDPLLLKLNQLQKEVNYLNSRIPKYEEQNLFPENLFPISADSMNTGRQNYEMDRFMAEDNHLKLPWFDRFMEMANNLYRCDINSSGSLPENKVKEIVEKYNDQLNLKLDSSDIRGALLASQRSHGSIDVNNFLKILAVKY